MAEGTTEPLLFARSVLVQCGIVRTLGGASKLLNRFEELGVWWPGGEAAPRGKGDGTEMWLPGRRPVGPAPDGGWRGVPVSEGMPGAVFNGSAVPVEAQ